MVRCIPGSGGVGDFYEDDKNEDGKNDNDNNRDGNDDDDVDHKNDDNDEDNLIFFRQQPTLVRCIPGRGGVVDFYDDDKNADGNNDNDN